MGAVACCPLLLLTAALLLTSSHIQATGIYDETLEIKHLLEHSFPLIKKMCTSGQLTLTGHSLGGAVASTFASFLNVSVSEIPLLTECLLENTDGVLRPPPPPRGTASLFSRGRHPATFYLC